MLYSRSLLAICFVYGSVYMSTQNSQFISPPHLSPLVTISLWICFCFINKFICINSFWILHISDIIWYLSFWTTFAILDGVLPSSSMGVCKLCSQGEKWSQIQSGLKPQGNMWLWACSGLIRGFHCPCPKRKNGTWLYLWSSSRNVYWGYVNKNKIWKK